MRECGNPGVAAGAPLVAELRCAMTSKMAAVTVGIDADFHTLEKELVEAAEAGILYRRLLVNSG